MARITVRGTQKDEEPVVRVQWGDQIGYIPAEQAEKFAVEFLRAVIAAKMDDEFLNSTGYDKIFWEEYKTYVEIE